MNIAALVSGGVDSAVAVHLLKEKGYNPDLFYIKIGPEEDKEWNCTSEEDIEICNWLAKKYGLKLQVVDLHDQYWDKVVRYTMDKARLGLTPNPDVMCNKLIKFGCFEDVVGKDYEKIATGHYATTDFVNGKTWLATSPDLVKDQTDFLCQINFNQLEKLLFPIGHLWKHEVRDIARKNGLLNAQRKDSQGICFLGRVDFRDYLKKYLGEKPGDVRVLETGKKIGTHKGVWFYTIGQRKGLGLGGGPWFVVKKNIKRNILFVSNGYNPDNVYKKIIKMVDFHFITENPWNACDLTQLHDITFKIRHTPEFVEGQFFSDNDGVWKIRAKERIHGVAPGQFCVIYDNIHHLCFGSGEII